MSIKFRQPPLELPPAWAKLVDAIRDVVQRSRFASLDELAIEIYRRPASSERRDGKRISELARGTRFPDADDLRKLIITCNPQAWSRVEPLFQAAMHERTVPRLIDCAGPDPVSGMDLATTPAAPPAARRRRQWALPVGGAAIVVGVMIVVLLSTTIGATGPTRWSDDFTGPTIDTDRWRVDAGSEVIYQRDGALHLVAPASKATTANSDGSNPRITAQPQGMEIKEFSFQMTFVSATGNASGGAGGAVFDRARLEYSAYVGPGGEVDTVALAVCAPTAGEVCNSEAGPAIERGKPVQIRMVWSGTGIDLYADSAQPVYIWRGVSPPTQAHFSLYADSGSVFEVAIDNVTIEFL